MFSCGCVRARGITCNTHARDTIKPFVDVNKTSLVHVGVDCSTGRGAIRNCTRLPDGVYQHCFSCKIYVTCIRERYILRLLPAMLVWDDNKKLGVFFSTTCVEPEEPPPTPR